MSVEVDVLLGRLATRCIKVRQQEARRPEGVRFEEGGYVAVGWWDGNIFRIEIAKLGPKTLTGDMLTDKKETENGVG